MIVLDHQREVVEDVGILDDAVGKRCTDMSREVLVIRADTHADATWLEFDR